MFIRIVVVMIMRVQLIVLGLTVRCRRRGGRGMFQLLPRFTQSRFAWYAGRRKNALVARHLDGIRICRELAANADRASVSNCQTSTIAALTKIDGTSRMIADVA